MACTRTLILPLITFNSFINIYVLYRILDSWRGLNNDAESEWEGGGHGQQLARSLAAILIAYIVLASTAAAIGFHGVYKRLPASVRLYLQFSFVDAVVYLLSMVVVALSVYTSHDWQDNICEELSIHADLLRALRTGGFDIENCEKWAEKLVMGGMTLLGLGLVLKLQFTIAVASYYTSLAKATGHQASVFSSVRIPRTRKLSRSSHRDRHILLTQPRSLDLPPYSDSVQTPTMGPEAAEAVAELVGHAGGRSSSRRSHDRDYHSHSSSSEDNSIDSKRRA